VVRIERVATRLPVCLPPPCAVAHFAPTPCPGPIPAPPSPAPPAAPFSRDRITSLSISSDCRWLLSASLDATVRVWDIPAGMCLQAMAMGAPVTCLSLSPARDLLATTHVNKRGVFLWSNQLMFGDAGSVAMHAARPVPVGLPSITTGARAEAPEGGKRRRGGAAMAVDGAGDGPSSSDDFYGGGSDTDSEGEAAGASSSGDEDGGAAGRLRRGGRAAGAMDVDGGGGGSGGGGGAAVYERVDAAGGGAPAPLSPELVTLSLLPRAQWETLLHLDAIKARSKPIQPPKKPEAAPFFLPTVPGLEGNPVFDAAVAAAGGGGGANGTAAAANGGGKARLAGWGDSGDDEAGGSGSGGEGEDGGGGGGAAAAHRASAPGSRVLHTKPASADLPASTFLRLLRAGGGAGDFASFLGHVRGLSPAALDRELRGMILLEGASEREVADVRLLLEALEGEAAAGRNYEFAQALLQHVLAVRAPVCSVRGLRRGWRWHAGLQRGGCA
jgi:hypothetical protein